MTSADLGGNETLIFDTGPLSHFAIAGWLGPLRAVVGSRSAVIPDVVEAELRRGATKDSRLKSVLEADWLQRRELTSSAELAAFGRFTARLAVGERNLSECGVLALGVTIQNSVVVIDDGAGRRAAQDEAIVLRPTLALLFEAINAGLLTVPLVSELADDLLRTQYRLPFHPGGFKRWAESEGHLPQ